MFINFCLYTIKISVSIMPITIIIHHFIIATDTDCYISIHSIRIITMKQLFHTFCLYREEEKFKWKNTARSGQFLVFYIPLSKAQQLSFEFSLFWKVSVSTLRNLITRGFSTRFGFLC